MNLILFKCFYRSGSFFFHDVNSANKNIATLPATDFLKYANTYKRHNLKKKILKKIQNQEGYFYTLRGFSKQFKEINFKNLKKDIFIDLHLLLSKNKKKKTHIFYHMHNDNEIDEIKKLKVKFDKIYFVTTVSNFNQGLKSFINHNQKKKYYILNEKINYYFRFYYFLRFLERIKLQRKLFRKFKFIRINQKNLNLNFKSTMNKYFQEINVDKKINYPQKFIIKKFKTKKLDNDLLIYAKKINKFLTKKKGYYSYLTSLSLIYFIAQKNLFTIAIKGEFPKNDKLDLFNRINFIIKHSILILFKYFKLVIM